MTEMQPTSVKRDLLAECYQGLWAGTKGPSQELLRANDLLRSAPQTTRPKSTRHSKRQQQSAVDNGPPESSGRRTAAGTPKGEGMRESDNLLLVSVAPALDDANRALPPSTPTQMDAAAKNKAHFSRYLPPIAMPDPRSTISLEFYHRISILHFLSIYHCLCILLLQHSLLLQLAPLLRLPQLLQPM